MQHFMRQWRILSQWRFRLTVQWPQRSSKQASLRACSFWHFSSHAHNIMLELPFRKLFITFLAFFWCTRTGCCGFANTSFMMGVVASWQSPGSGTTQARTTREKSSLATSKNVFLIDGISIYIFWCSRGAATYTCRLRSCNCCFMRPRNDNFPTSCIDQPGWSTNYW